jgi:hypothetical protein
MTFNTGNIMSKSIYKYVGPTSVQKVFALDKQVTLKCSYPKDFNDPYELFLTVDFNEQPDILAFYADAVGELPQLPTTCFSLSPSVVPMWAHYAQNLEGFVIEFDEEKLAGYFPESGFGDVDYQDVSDAGLTDMLYRASEIGKPRYVYLLRKGVFSAAYYTKATCWNYEQERRMILPDSETRKVDNIILMDVPNDCVTALISGPRSSGETITAHSINLLLLLGRHIAGDYGDLSIEDVEANILAVQHDLRIFSSYKFGSNKIWIITEADRSATCRLMPDEY